MNLIKRIKNIAFAAALLFLLLPQHAQSQLVNNGATITVTNGAILYANQYITNDSGGVLINDGTTIAHTDITNAAGGTLKGSGTYSIQGNFTNLGTYNPELSVLNFFGTGNSYLQNNSRNIYVIQMSKVSNSFVDVLDSETVTGGISFGNDSNWLRLNNNNLTLGADAYLANCNENKYIITNGNGAVKKKNVNSTPFLFPVGFDEKTYNPVTITENGTADDYSVQCLDHALVNGSSGSAIATGGINAGWIINQAIPSGANATIAATWNTTDELPGFDYTHCMITRYYNNKWDYAANKAAAATGNPYRSISRSGLTGLGYFTVLSKAIATLTNESLLAQSAPMQAMEMKSSGIKVYPTIAKSYVTVAVGNVDNSIHTMNISVVDGNGKVVLQKQNAGFQSQQLTLSNLAPGFYTVFITYGSNKFSQKIIISR